MNLSTRLWLIIAFGTLSPGALPAQETVDPERKTSAARHELYRSEAAAYEFQSTGTGKATFDFRAGPVMQWVSLNDFDGDVFVWTRDGRPEVIGSIFSFAARGAGQRNVLHEFHSLSDDPVEGRAAEGTRVSLAALPELRPIPGAPIPSESPAARRLQARALSREFSGHMQRQDQRWELRLLNQPIYSYEEGPRGLLGGAVFAFVGYVTDPEILLLIEARQTAEGPRWVYVPTRFSDKSLWLEHKGDEVWTYLRDAPSEEESPYYLSRIKTVSLSDD